MLGLGRIIQFCLLLFILVMIIFIAIVDGDHTRSMFYTAGAIIICIGIWLARGLEEFQEHMNEQIREQIRKEK